MTQPYTSAFFEERVDGSLSSARAILPEVLTLVPARSVIDIGCGSGAWLFAARELGVETILGVDGAYVQREALLIGPDQFLACELQDDFASSVAARRPAPFDLALCLEVAEHLPYDCAAVFAERLSRLSDAILFSAAVPFQTGVNHVNEQWPEFWALLFRGCGFQCCDGLRTPFWARLDVGWWYAQNLLLFVRRGSEAFARLPPAMRVEPGALSIVHPGNYLLQILHGFRPHRAAAREEEIHDIIALSRAWMRGASSVPPLAAIERAAAAPVAARDVFPYTRTEMATPEDDERRLAAAKSRIAELEAELAALLEAPGVAPRATAARPSVDALNDWRRTPDDRREDGGAGDVSPKNVGNRS